MSGSQGKQNLELDPAKSRAFVGQVLAWAPLHRRSFPWRETSNVWQISVAEVLLVRTPSGRAQPVFEALMLRYPTPGELASASPGDLYRVLKPLGLQEKKVEQLRAVSELFRDEDEKRAVAALERVCGVGPYVSNAVAMLGLGVPRPLVDGNIGRIFGRYFGIEWRSRAVTDRAAWNLAEQLLCLAADDFRNYSLGLLDLAAAHCRARPDCLMCPLQTDCEFFRKSDPA